MTRPGPVTDLALMGHTTHRAVVVTPSETFPGLLHVRRGDDWIGDFGPSAVFGITPHSCRPDDLTTMRCACGGQFSERFNMVVPTRTTSADDDVKREPHLRTPEEQKADEEALAARDAWRAKANTHTKGAILHEGAALAIWRTVERHDPDNEVEWILRRRDGSQSTGRIPREGNDCWDFVKKLVVGEWGSITPYGSDAVVQPDPVWDHEQGDDIPF